MNSNFGLGGGNGPKRKIDREGSKGILEIFSDILAGNKNKEEKIEPHVEPSPERPDPVPKENLREYWEAIKIDPNAPKQPFNPCDFEYFEKTNFYLTKEDCNPLVNINAQTCVDKWQDRDPSQTHTARDLNNVGCAYLWMGYPRFLSAKRLFSAALTIADDNNSKAVIQRNLARLQ